MGRDRADALVAAGIVVIRYCELLSSHLSVYVSRVGQDGGRSNVKAQVSRLLSILF